MTVQAARPGVSLRKITLPSEHGSWGFLIEPILLGLLVAQSAAGAWLALAALAGFLVRHPLMLAIGDIRRGHRYPRTTAAIQVAAVYAVASLGFLLMAARLAPAAFWIPLAAAIVPAAVFLYNDANRQVRSLAGELGGAIAMGSLAVSIAICGGWTVGAAFCLWALLAARTVPTILYVRMQVRRLHGKDVSAAGERWAHVLGVVAVFALVVSGHAPLTSLLAMAIVASHSLLGEVSPPESARGLGWAEMLVGIVCVVLIALGYRMGA